jgi:nucleoid-associated protein Lsr2
MATQTTTRLIDDLDGSEAQHTVTFALEGRAYEVDLSKKNVAAFEKAMKPYLAVARSARSASSPASRRGRSTGTAARSRRNLQAIREWARANGHEVSDRGRVSASVIEAYEAAQ